MTGAAVTARRVVLVHGAWHGAWAWDPLLPELRRLGIDPATVDLPSAHGAGDLRDDARAVRELVLSSDEETVLVGHSYGGLVISEASADLAPVTHLVYLCAFLFDVGRSLVGATGGPAAWQDVDPDTGVIRVPAPEPVFYHDVPSDLAAEWSARLGPQTVSSFSQPLSAAGWRRIPSTYLVCTQDRAIPPVAQRAMAADATTVHELDSGHSPFASAPAHVARLIAGCAAPAPTDAAA